MLDGGDVGTGAAPLDVPEDLTVDGVDAGRPPWIGLAVWWALLAVAVFFHAPPSVGPFALIAVPAQAFMWVVGTVWLVRWLGRAGMGWSARTTALMLSAVAAFAVINWSVWAPQAYFATHRYLFTAMAHEFDSSGDGSTYPALTGGALPITTRLASVDGTGYVAGEQNGRPVFFVPEFIKWRDGAVGYAYFAGTPSDDTEIDLLGDPAIVAKGQYLGDGWWYVPG